MADLINTKHFDKICEAALVCARKDDDDIDEPLAAPTQAIKVKYDLQLLCRILEGLHLRNHVKNTARLQQIDAFKRLLQLHWRKSVGQACLNTLHHRSLFKFHELPTPSDLATLANHLISTIEILNLSEVDDGRVSRRFKDAVTYIQARLLVFNKRRSGELEATRLVLLHACSYWEMD